MGYKVQIANTPSDLENCQKLILPGVGSFSKAMENLNSGGWTDKLNELVKIKKLPILGICLGMHLFANSSNEVKKTKGLQFIDGDVVCLDEIGCKKRLPHVGWNEVKLKKGSFSSGVEQNSDFYFVHSYCYKSLTDEIVLGTTNYDIEFVSIIKNENIYGTQFHPEKSSFAGKRILQNFLKIS